MKTINLKEKSPSVTQLISAARKTSVLLVSEDGASFILEEADQFDREVAELGSSGKFMSFLMKRAKEPGVVSIEEFAEQLVAETPKTTLQPPSRARRKSKARKNPRAARG
jgi:hypothetical protein